jgi:hypothetical protein
MTSPDIPSQSVEFNMDSAERTIIDLGREAIKAGQADEFVLVLADLAKQMNRHDEEERGQKSTGFNPFKQSKEG